MMFQLLVRVESYCWSFMFLWQVEEPPVVYDEELIMCQMVLTPCGSFLPDNGPGVGRYL